MAQVLFADLELKGAGLDEAWKAFEENEAGTVQCALDSFGRHRPAAQVFLGKVRAGEHRRRLERRTGWRMVRGSHGVSYVRDPRGVDPLPLPHNAA